MKVSEDRYENMESVELENEKLKLTILPRLGSKIISLIDKQTRKDLVWRSKKKLKLPNYGDVWENFDRSGFDEMFPTINQCCYPDEPWQGVILPDHGEVWTLPWKYEIGRENVHLWVYGIRLPYRLEKRITLSDSEVKIQYKVSNNCAYPIKFIWAFHPPVRIEPGTKIAVPSDIRRIRVTYTAHGRLGGYGKEHPWPIIQDDKGGQINLNEISSPEARHAEKFYATNKLTEGWVTLNNPKIARCITFSFPPDKVPYLGLWINEGGWHGDYNVAPEPATGMLDRLDVADLWNSVSSVGSGESYQWYLNITLSKVD